MDGIRSFGLIDFPLDEVAAVIYADEFRYGISHIFRRAVNVIGIEFLRTHPSQRYHCAPLQLGFEGSNLAAQEQRSNILLMGLALVLHPPMVSGIRLGVEP